MTHYDSLYEYQNGNYRVTIFEDGTKIRETEEKEFIPAFAENCDVKITDRCDGGCPFCYEGCTALGKHAKLFDSYGRPVQEWLKHLHPGTELALNGNDLSHPDLLTLLTWLQAQHVIANLTVNQKHFMKYYETLKVWCDSRLIWGLGVSLADSGDSEFLDKLYEFPNAVLHTIAGVLRPADILKLTAHPKSSSKLKILILGYKELGRGVSYLDNPYNHVQDYIQQLQHELPKLVKSCRVVSFDNLALKQLNVKETLFRGRVEDWETFYMGDDGTMTYYIDAVKEEYAKNSCMPQKERFPSVGLTVDQMFQDIRRRYEQSN